MGTWRERCVKWDPLRTFRGGRKAKERSRAGRHARVPRQGLQRAGVRLGIPIAVVRSCRLCNTAEIWSREVGFSDGGPNRCREGCWCRRRERMGQSVELQRHKLRCLSEGRKGSQQHSAVQPEAAVEHRQGSLDRWNYLFGVGCASYHRNGPWTADGGPWESASRPTGSTYSTGHACHQVMMSTHYADALALSSHIFVAWTLVMSDIIAARRGLRATSFFSFTHFCRVNGCWWRGHSSCTQFVCCAEDLL